MKEKTFNTQPGQSGEERYTDELEMTQQKQNTFWEKRRNNGAKLGHVHAQLVCKN